MSFRFPKFFLPLGALALLSTLGGCATHGGFSEPSAVVTEGLTQESVLRTLRTQVTDLAVLPSWRMGDYWEYSDGYGLQVVETDGKVATLKRTDRPDDWVKRDGLFKIDSMDDGVQRKVIYRSPDPSALFPLVIGKNVSFVREYLADKKLHVHKTSWAVLGRETIEVPAGKFDCWVLEWSTRSQKSNWSGYEKWWYSPEVRNYVRMEYRYGKVPDSSRVLVKYIKGL